MAYGSMRSLQYAEPLRRLMQAYFTPSIEAMSRTRHLEQFGQQAPIERPESSTIQEAQPIDAMTGAAPQSMPPMNPDEMRKDQEITKQLQVLNAKLRQVEQVDKRQQELDGKNDDGTKPAIQHSEQWKQAVRRAIMLRGMPPSGEGRGRAASQYAMDPEEYGRAWMEKYPAEGYFLGGKYYGPEEWEKRQEAKKLFHERGEALEAYKQHDMSRAAMLGMMMNQSQGPPMQTQQVTEQPIFHTPPAHGGARGYGMGAQQYGAPIPIPMGTTKTATAPYGAKPLMPEEAEYLRAKTDAERARADYLGSIGEMGMGGGIQDMEDYEPEFGFGPSGPTVSYKLKRSPPGEALKRMNFMGEMKENAIRLKGLYQEKFTGPVNQFAGRFRTAVGWASPEEVEFQFYIDNFIKNAYSLSGAQIGLKEIERLARLSPQLSEPKETFQPKLDIFIETVMRNAQRQSELFRRTGYRGFDNGSEFLGQSQNVEDEAMKAVTQGRYRGQ